MSTTTTERETIGTTEFPTVAEVAAALANVRRIIEDACDVRLQVYEDGAWAVRYGSSDYDQDHRGYWGASSVCVDDDDNVLRLVALDLIDQAKDSVSVCVW